MIPWVSVRHKETREILQCLSHETNQWLRFKNVSSIQAKILEVRPDFADLSFKEWLPEEFIPMKQNFRHWWIPDGPMKRPHILWLQFIHDIIRTKLMEDANINRVNAFALAVALTVPLVEKCWRNQNAYDQALMIATTEAFRMRRDGSSVAAWALKAILDGQSAPDIFQAYHNESRTQTDDSKSGTIPPSSDFQKSLDTLLMATWRRVFGSASLSKISKIPFLKTSKQKDDLLLKIITGPRNPKKNDDSAPLWCIGPPDYRPFLDGRGLKPLIQLFDQPFFFHPCSFVSYTHHMSNIPPKQLLKVFKRKTIKLLNCGRTCCQNRVARLTLKGHKFLVYTLPLMYPGGLYYPFFQDIPLTYHLAFTPDPHRETLSCLKKMITAENPDGVILQGFVDTSILKALYQQLPPSLPITNLAEGNGDGLNFIHPGILTFWRKRQRDLMRLSITVRNITLYSGIAACQMGIFEDSKGCALIYDHNKIKFYILK